MEEKISGKSNFGVRGWLLIIMCLLGCFISASSSGSLNVSASYFNATFGWSQTSLMLGATLGSLTGSLLTIVLRPVLLKISPRRVILVCAIAYAVCFILNGRVTQLWQFYLTFIVVVASAFMWAMICNATLIANWFPRKRGLAMGWVTIGMPLGSGVAALLMRMVYVRVGFYESFYPYAILALAVEVIDLVFLRDFPTECGCYPDNDKNFDYEQLKAEEEAIRKTRAASPWTAKRIFGTKEFWFIVLAISFMMFAAGFMAQVVVTLVSFGISAQVATYAMMGVCVIACLGSYILGVADTKLGSKKAMIITFACVIAMALVAQLNFLPAKLLAFVFLGIVMGAGSNFMLSIIMANWGKKNCMNVYQFAQPISTVISAFSTTVISGVAAIFGGNYNMSFLFVGLLSVIGLILIINVREGAVQKREQSFTDK